LKSLDREAAFQRFKRYFVSGRRVVVVFHQKENWIHLSSILSWGLLKNEQMN
jgi:hypothetical protein